MYFPVVVSVRDAGGYWAAVAGGVELETGRGVESMHPVVTSTVQLHR